MKHLVSLALVVFLGLACSVQASSITYNTTTPIPYTLTDWNGSLSFPKFDTSMGTLTSVELILAGQFSTVITVTNTGASPSTGTAKTEVAVTVQDSGNNLSVPQLDMFSSNFGFTNLPADGGQVTSGTINKSAGSDDVYTSAAVLAEFSGSGAIVLPASTYTQTWIAYNGGNSNAVQVTNAQLTGSVIYHYNAVPEPASLAILGIGAIGLVGYWLRRR